MKITFLKVGAVVMGLIAFSSAGAQVSSAVSSTTNATINAAPAVNGAKTAVQQTTNATKTATQNAVNTTSTTVNEATKTRAEASTNVNVSSEAQNDVIKKTDAEVKVAAEQKATPAATTGARQTVTDAKKQTKEIRQTATQAKPAIKADANTATKTTIKTGN